MLRKINTIVIETDKFGLRASICAFFTKKSAPEALILPGCEKCPFLAGNKLQKSDMGTPLGWCNSGLLNIAVIKSMPFKEPPHELKY